MLPKDAFDKLHAKVQVSLVRVVGVCAGKPEVFAPGVVIVKNRLYCYIITDKETFSYGSEGKYAVSLPGSKVEVVMINFSDVSIAGSFASFMLHKPKGTNPLAAVKISESGPLPRQEVYTLGYQNPSVSTTHLSPGTVRFVGKDDFVHNCASGTFSAFGAPVFTVVGDLVGICFNNRGAIRAYKVQTIIQHVQMIQTQITSQAIKNMLQPFMDQQNVLLEKRKAPIGSSAGASKKSKTRH